MSGLLGITGLGLGIVTLWIVVGAGSAVRPLGDAPFRERVLAMCFVTAPIFAAVAILLCGLPLLATLPMDARPFAIGAGLVAFLVFLVGGPFALWELSKTRPPMQRLWRIAGHVRQKNLEPK